VRHGSFVELYPKDRTFVSKINVLGQDKKKIKRKKKRFKYASITWYQPQTLDVASE
jgi:hypothetical protein